MECISNSTYLTQNVHGLCDEDKDRLLRSPLLKELAPALKMQLLEMGQIQTLKRNEMLFLDGDKVRGFYFILSGKIKEYYPTSEGDECLRRILFPGNYISLHKVFERESTYTYYGEVICRMRCFFLRSRDFTHLMTTEPPLAMVVAEILSNHVEHSYRHNCLCRKTLAISRVAGYLLKKNLQICQNEMCFYECKHPSFQADLRPLNLAAMDVCLARETFSRALSALQEKGHIKVNNGIADILNLDELKKISGAI